MAQNQQRSIVVIGASSGGLEALIEIVGGLAPDLDVALFVVVHTSAQATSVLPQILARAGRLPAAHAQNGEVIQPGRIYVAPPDFHLLLRDGRTEVVRGPKENNHRPAVDPLFRSAAQAYGPRVIGIVLSGSLDDGAAGLFAIKNRGGIAIVQDPQDATFPDMPRAALAAVSIDYCVSKKEIATLIHELSRIPKPDGNGKGATVADDKMEKEIAVAAFSQSVIEDDDKAGTPSVYGCPDCGGTLWELQDDRWMRFRCRVGHAYSAEGLLGSQSENLEKALWSAFRGLQENAALARRLAERARANRQGSAAEKFEIRAQRAEEEARLIRELLINAQRQDQR
jgi:two-component system, chemotaxis family, protein-glutamate methylesterase/glutaminase